jgi:hypothetical protein
MLTIYFTQADTAKILTFLPIINIKVIYFWWELRASCLHCSSHTSSPFCSGYFEDGVSRTICLDWSQTVILPIAASQVAKIIAIATSTWLHYKNLLMRYSTFFFHAKASKSGILYLQHTSV